MITKYKRKSLMFGLPGFLLQMGFLALLFAHAPKYGPDSTPPPGWVATLEGYCFIFGTILWLVGLCYYAVAKGYSFTVGFLGLFCWIGLLVLLVLPDKANGQNNNVAHTAPEPDTTAQSVPKASLPPILGKGCPRCGAALITYDKMTFVAIPIMFFYRSIVTVAIVGVLVSVLIFLPSRCSQCGTIPFRELPGLARTRIIIKKTLTILLLIIILICAVAVFNALKELNWK